MKQRCWLEATTKRTAKGNECPGSRIGKVDGARRVVSRLHEARLHERIARLSADRGGPP